MPARNGSLAPARDRAKPQTSVSIDCMFDDWRRDEHTSRVLRRFVPARPILVDMTSAMPGPIGLFPGHEERSLPLIVVGAGLRLETWMPGLLDAWVRQSTGRWWAVVRVEAWSGNSLGHLTMRLWVTPDAIIPDTPRARVDHRMHEVKGAPWNREWGR